MSFCTAINCVDGRVQLPVIRFLQERFHVSHVDSITETGPVRIFHKVADLMTLNSIFNRINHSIRYHDSRAIAVCAHADCDSNPVDETIQKQQLQRAMIFLKESYPDKEIVGLWVNESLDVREIAL